MHSNFIMTTIFIFVNLCFHRVDAKWGFYNAMDLTADSNAGVWNDLPNVNKLMRVTVYLDSFESREAADQKLNTLFQNAHKNAFHLIIRFAYKDYQNQDTFTIKADSARYAQLLKTNRTIITAIQAGFLGPWGEWHDIATTPWDTTKDTSDAKNIKQYIVNQWKKVGRPIQLRYPADIATYYRNDAMIGMHDDCLGAQGVDWKTSQDSGTWDKPNTLTRGDIPATKTWMITRKSSLSNAESCSDAGDSISNCKDLLNVLDLYKISSYNLDYPANIKNMVQDSSCQKGALAIMHKWYLSGMTNMTRSQNMTSF